MTRRIYRTAQGKMVDLGAMQLQNENVRAVGNMKVNARGDLIDSQNQPIDSRSQQVNKQYRRQTSNVSDTSVAKKKSSPVAPAPLATETNVSPTTSVIEPVTETSGLAAAIAKARQIKQEPIRTAQDLTNQTSGISKI
jgi:hypothetical protein